MLIIKRYIDNSKQMGEYWLTGSQDLNVLKTVSKSLAGRAAILSLYPMSLAETQGKTTTWIIDYLRDPIAYLEQYRHQPISREPNTLYKQIWRGGYPGLLDLEDDMVHLAAGDKGYLSKQKEATLAGHGLKLITRVRKKMKQHMLMAFEQLFLSYRGLVETVIEQLKSLCQIEHSRYRNPINYFVNLLSGLAAYRLRPRKPAIKNKQ